MLIFLLSANRPANNPGKNVEFFCCSPTVRLTNRLIYQIFRVSAHHDRQIAKSNLITLGTEGVIDAANNGYEFVDHTKDFMAMAITLHESAESNDGDYLRIPAGANAGYHKILDIIDRHTLVLASELQSASSEDYEIRSKGYIIEEELTGFSLRLTPYLGFSGSVAVSFKALRTDQAKPFE